MTIKKIYLFVSIASGLNTFSQTFAGGEAHSLAICKDSTVRSWGWNSNGQLGVGNNTDSNIPIQVSSINGIVAVSAGGYHSMALKKNGAIYTWGWNSSGQLGNGTNTDSNSPVPVNSLTGIIAVAAGQYHSLALKNDGTVWAWGNNQYGQLGNGTNNFSSVPVQVNSLAGIIAIAAGGGNSLALKNDSTVWAWGDNTNGQLGNGTNNVSNIAVKVNSLSGIAFIATGGGNSLALKNDYSLWAWGANLGNGLYNVSNIPIQVNSISGTTGIAGGSSQSLALKYNGKVRAWGQNSSGQLGDGTNTDSDTPMQVTSFTANAIAIAAGASHSLTKKNDGSLWAWGSNFAGQLGNGTNADSNFPVQVIGLCQLVAGIKENEIVNQNFASIYPNPNNGSFKLKVENQIENGELLIINSLGQEVYRQKIIQGENNVITHDFTMGLYQFILLEAKQKICNGKILIQ